MTQRELDRQVAVVTGENLCEIRQRGFSCANPDVVDHDPEPCDVDIEDMIVDWDALHAQRQRNNDVLPAFQRVACYA